MDVFERQPPPDLAASGGVSSVSQSEGRNAHFDRDGGSSVDNACQSFLPCDVSEEMAGAELFVPSLSLFTSSRTIVAQRLNDP
ncbi:hypothetical protein ZIOFF_007688 [Zingiber officinale]|uniref:Uncharacterized protein n=1 Tax=Zingiber officinale TaxID=94328 RepID=A0A8J5I2A7_ZINOF|nr:hypothetical protein ZIOFF_007688 [Zingiber officinale]